jgi:exonuclease III
MNFQNSFAFLTASGTRGGILVAYKDSTLQLLNTILTNHIISITVIDARTNRNWSFTGVYGPQGELEKKMFIRELRQLKHQVQSSWLLMGDFNLIYKDTDKNNGHLNRRLMLRSRRALNHMEVKEA